jgi:hypothetical protein
MPQLISSADASETASLTSEMTVAPYSGPQLYPLDDLPFAEGTYTDTNNAQVRFEAIRARCNRQGRIAHVKLERLVHYDAAAIASRVWGGIIQEFQFFPAEHAALVVFLDPNDAAAFIQHHDTLKAHSAHEHRRLQIHAEWYLGLELESLYHAQKQLLASVLAMGVSRVLLLNGISVHMKQQELLADLKIKLRDKLVVRVSLLTPGKRYVQKRDGNMLRLEFGSIRDAVEAFRRFRAGTVEGYKHCDVEYLMDPAMKPKPHQQYCRCAYCIEGWRSELFGRDWAD